jgi:hypothetical protein
MDVARYQAPTRRERLDRLSENITQAPRARLPTAFHDHLADEQEIDDSGHGSEDCVGDKHRLVILLKELSASLLFFGKRPVNQLRLN